MTTANKVTILRILLVPFFICQMLYYGNGGAELHRWLAVAAFALCALSDGVDGYIARRYNQRSELGALLDPLADKLLLVSGVVFLSFDHRPYLPPLPLWLVTTIVSRDLLLVIGWSVIHHVCGRVTVRPRISGKIATVLQNGRRALGLAQMARRPARIPGARHGLLHRIIWVALLLGWREATERQPAQRPDRAPAGAAGLTMNLRPPSG
jgi:CDP-diacylglycerol--glycerol-3-phosphate 3-phosphatidyltransferase